MVESDHGKQPSFLIPDRRRVYLFFSPACLLRDTRGGGCLAAGLLKTRKEPPSSSISYFNSIPKNEEKSRETSVSSCTPPV